MPDDMEDRAGHPAHQAAKDTHAGHVDHSGHEQMFRDRFWAC
jgi:hypothetical protein